MLLERVSETNNSHHFPFKKKFLQNQHTEIYDTVPVGVNIHRSKPPKVLANYCHGMKEYLQVP